MLSYKAFLSRFCIILMMSVGLSACQTLSSGEVAERTQSQLDRIDIMLPDTRLEQIFNRQLSDNFNQNAGLRDLALSTRLTKSSSSTLAVRGKSSTLSKTSMTLTYALEDKLSKKVLTNGKITVTATSGTISSYYGQDKSQQFASERLSRQLADKLTLRLRRYFLEKSAEPAQS